MALIELAKLNNGTYFEEIRHVLHLKSDRANIVNQFRHYFETIKNNKGDAELIFANGVLVQQDLQANKKLQEISALDGFSSDVEFASLKGANYCNKKEGTFGRTIANSQEDNNQTDYTLMSAINMKSQFHRWLNRYRPVSVSVNEINESAGKDNSEEFYGLGLIVFSDHFPYVILNDLGAHAVRMDYKNSSLSLVIIKPRGIDISNTNEKSHIIKYR